MPGYCLIEQKCLVPYKTNGVRPHPNVMGFLDFLRELSNEELPFPKFYEVRLVGLEEVLYASRPEEATLALEIHRLLRRAASDLESKLLSVQVVFTGKLVRGDVLWVEYRGQRLPIDHIFGSSPRRTDPRGNLFYATNFNLTNG